MVTAKHKQTGKTETVHIQTWLQKYNHELWEVMEIKDAVDLYDYYQGNWRLHNIIEMEDAMATIALDPNNFKYEYSSLNTVANLPDLNEEEMLFANEVLKSATAFPVIELNNFHYPNAKKVLQFLVTTNLLNEVEPYKYILTEPGKIAARYSYQNWLHDQKPKKERISAIVKFANENSWITLTKSDTDQFCKDVIYAVDTGYLKETASGNFRPTAKGQDFYEGIQHEIVKDNTRSAATIINNYHHAPVTNVGNLENSKLHVNQGDKTINKNGKEDNSLMKWLERFIILIAALATIYTAYRAFI